MINFPTNPTSGETYTVNNKQFTYNGVGFVPTLLSYTGSSVILGTDIISGKRNGTLTEWNYSTLKNDILSGVTVTGSYLPLSGGTLTGTLSGTSISATTFYGDGSNLTGVISNHNNLFGLQGGESGQYYHLTQDEYALVSGSSLDDRYVNVSGDTLTGQLKAPSFSANTYYGSASNLTGISGVYLPLSGGSITGGLSGTSISATTLYGNGSNLTNIDHNTTINIQGGLSNERYHLNLNEYSAVSGNSLNLKAMQFVGICKRIGFQPTDISINPTANTISISTVNGVAISTNNPLRYFTDGSGMFKEHVQTTTAVASFTNTTGVWYVYFDTNSNFVCTQAPWSDFDLLAPVYRFYLNATLPDATKIVVRAYEGHLNVMSAEVHAVLHANGTVHLDGFDLIHNVVPINASGVPTVAPNADGRNAVISLTNGRNSDDGLEYSVTHSTTPTLSYSQNLGEQSSITLNATNAGLFKIRTNNIGGVLNFLPATRFPFSFNTTTNYAEYITSTGVRTSVADNRWFVYYVYALQDDKPTEPVKVVSAEVEFTTYALAQSHDWVNLQALYATLRDKEIRPLYKLIFYHNPTGGGSYNIGTKFSALVSFTDIRTTKTQNVTASSSGGIVLASNVILTPPVGYVSTEVQSFTNEIVTNLNLDKDNLTAHTSNTSIHFTKSSINLSDLGSSGHTHSISGVTNLQTSLDNKTDLSLFNSHSGDTSIHYPKSGITLSQLGDSAHTHTIVDVTNLQSSLDNKTDLNLFTAHTGNTTIHFTKSSINLSDLGNTAHTHTIGNVLNLQSSLDNKLSLSGGTLTGSLSGTSISATTFYGNGSNLTGVVSTHNALSGLQGGLANERYHLNISDYQKVTGGTFALNSSLSAHTGDTSIHFTKSSINLSDLGSSGHTHSITDVLNLQTSLNNKTDLSLFNSHTGATNPHLTKFSDLIVTAHTHTIADVSNLQTTLNSKLNLSGGTMTGTLIGTTISASTYQGIKASHVVNDSTNVTGANLKTVLDNATLAVDGVSIQDADLFPIAREVATTGGTFVSTNMYHPWGRIKEEIKSTCGTYYINTFEEFKTIVEDPLTPSDNITFYLSNDSVFSMFGTITGHTENIYIKAQNSASYLADLTINTTLLTPNRIYFDGVCIATDTEMTITLPSDTTSLIIKELVCDEQFPNSLNILVSGAGSFQYNNATNISRSRIQNDYQYALWDAIRQDEKWAYSHFRPGSGLDLVGKTIAKVTGISDAYGNFSIKVRYRLCYNEADLVLPLFPATLPHGKWVRFETCDFCRDKARGEGGIYVSPRGFEVAKFYKGDSDLVVTNGSFSNEAGAGSIYENQYDDNNTYFSSVVRSTLAQSTFKVKYTDPTTTDDNDTWIIVHLRGVIL